MGANEFHALYRHKPSAAVLVFCIGMTLPGPGLTYALPTDYTVEEGTVSGEQTGPDALHFHIQSDQAILGFSQFNVAAPETVEFHFHQPTAGSSALSRVSGGQPSDIAGTLTSNGQLFLVNPAGIHIADTARIQAAGFVASTLNITNADFLARDYRFEQDPNQLPAAVINEGRIETTATGGLIALLGGGVVNEGVIVAQLGTVALAAGEKITLGFDQDGSIAVTVDQPLSHVASGLDGKPLPSAIQQSGTLSAPGGHVLIAAKALEGLFDQVVNNTGLIEANSVVSQNGQILLVAEGGTLEQAGQIHADGTAQAPEGGQIFLEGTRIVQRGSVTANAAQGGQAGQIRVLGLEEIVLAPESRLEAKAASFVGQGGSIVVTSTQPKVTGQIQFQTGSVIDVSGGGVSGDAGSITLSARDVQFNGRVVGEAQEGFSGGRLLVDPLNLIFNTTSQAAPPNNASGTPDIAFNAPPVAGTTTVEIADIIGFAEAFFQATQDITVNNPLTMNNNNDLRLEAGRNINLNANVRVQGGSGDMTLIADADFSGSGGPPSDGVGNIVQAAGTSIRAANGNMLLQTGGDFVIRTITGGGSGTISIASTGGNILDDGNAATRITGNVLSLTANATGKGVGTTGALNTDMNTLNLNVGSGGASLRDIGSFTLNTPTLASGANLDLRANTNLTITNLSVVATTGTGGLTLVADADSNGSGTLVMGSGSLLSTASGNLTLSDAGGLDLRTVTSTGGNLTTSSRGNVRVRNQMTTGGSGTITIGADSEGNGTGTFVQDVGSTIATGGGNITISGADPMILRTINAGTGNVFVTGVGAGTNVDDDGNNATQITGNTLTITSGGRIGASGLNNQIDTSVNLLHATATGGSIFLTNDKTLSLGTINAGTGNVTLTSGGSLLDGNGAALNLTAGGPSTLTAAGVIGTASDPLEVLVTGGNLNVSAGSQASGVSVDISGTVTPSNTLNLLASPPGQVIFNGQVIFPVLLPPPPPVQTQTPVVVLPPAPAPNLVSSSFPGDFFTQALSFIFAPENRRRSRSLS